MKNKYLLIVFVVLLAIYAGISLFGDKKESSFDDKIVDFDLESVDMIKIHPKDNAKKDFSIEKEGDEWIIKSEDDSFMADEEVVNNAINSLGKMKVKNIITKNPEKFSKYELEDGKCKEVKVFSGNKRKLDLLIGKFKFNQQTRSASSYIRIAGRNEVYSTDGFSSINISDNISTYRIKDLAKFDPGEVKTIKYFHNDTIKELTKQGKDWTYGNVIVDSTKIANYLSSVSKMKGVKFIELNSSWQKSSAPDSIVFSLQDKDLSIVAYSDTIVSKNFVIHSSVNEKAYFDSDSTGIYKRIFGKFEELVK